MGGAFGDAETAKLDHTNLRERKAQCREHRIQNFRHALLLHMQTAQCKSPCINTESKPNTGN